jgi:hypothetical protein
MRTPAPTAERLHARALAGARRETMRVRARRIRRAVAALAVTLFVTAFLIVYVQLASGHDPALTTNAAKRRAAVVSTERSGAPSTSESTSTETDSDPTESTTGSGSTAGTEETSGESSETSSASGESSSSGDESNAGAESSSGTESSSGASAVTTSQS